jgi:hypothetical protein
VAGEGCGSRHGGVCRVRFRLSLLLISKQSDKSGFAKSVV